MREIPDIGPRNRGGDTPAEPPATGPTADEGSPAPLRLVVDFNRLQQRPDVTASIEVVTATAPMLAGVGLREGMRAVIEEPGELQMTGVLHLRASTIGLPGSGDSHVAVGEDRWEGVLDPRSTIYHVRVEPLTLYYAGPEGCGHYHEWVEVADTDATDTTALAPAALLPAGRMGGTNPDPDPHRRLRPPLETRPRRSARQLTLGVEGTYDQWQRPLAARTVYGEAALDEGEGIVLIDEAREVDATVLVFCQPTAEW